MMNTINNSINTFREFCDINDIKWMPVALLNKRPVNINHEAYFRKNKKNQSTFTPNFTEFLTISNEVLKQRQQLFLDDEIMNYVDNKNDIKIRIAIDTYNVFQIDIDSPDVDQYFIQQFSNGDCKTAYYKSLTKSYGKHIFIKLSNVNDFRDYIKNNTSSSATTVYQFKNSFKNEYNDVIDIFKTGGLELLTGKWGYIDVNTPIINNKIFEFSNESIISIINVAEKKQEVDKLLNQDVKENVKESSIGESSIKSVFENHRYLDDEIRDHMNNIDMKYIDDRSHHFKLICSILDGGYYEIARECMFRSSNTKNKDLNYEFESFKDGNKGLVKINTLFYYSKLSDENSFNNLLRKHRGMSLKPCDKKHLINLDYITENINERYLPYRIMENIDMKTPSILHIKSHLGTGKTTIIKQFIKNNPELKVLYFAPRVLFAIDIHNDLKDVGFKLYRDIKKNDEIPDRVITQLESCYRFKKSFDVIILDEVESVLKQITSVKTNSNIYETYNAFSYFIKNANLIITADAFLTNNSITTINNIKNNCRSSVIVNNNIPYKRNAYEIAGLDNLYNKALDQVKRNEKIVFITLSETKGRELTNKFKTEFVETNEKNLKSHKSIDNPIFTKKIKYYYGGMSEKDKKFDNINEEWKDVDILIYTPVITCGVNYDPMDDENLKMATFHSLYMWIIPYSCVIRDLFQASMRVRNLINNECFFAFSYHYNTFIKKNVVINNLFKMCEGDLEKIYINLTNNQEIITNLSPFFGTIPKLHDWGKRNLAFKIYEEYISNNQMVQLTHEYFRLCGYTIYPIENIDELKNIGTKPGQKYIGGLHKEIHTLNDPEYNALVRLSICDLTETEKISVLKYKFDKYFHNLNHDTPQNTIMIQQLWKTFYNKPDILDNFYYEFNNISKHTEQIQKENNDDGFKTFDLFVNNNLLKKHYVDNILKIFKKDNIFELNKDGFHTEDINKNIFELTENITKCKSLFNIRAKQGSNLESYLNSCIKHIFYNYYGIQFFGKRQRIDGKRGYLYKNKDFDMTYSLLEKYMTNNETHEEDKPKQFTIKIKKKIKK